MTGFIAILVLMTAAPVAAAVWPFVFKPRAERSGSDVEVYRDQLKELESDREAGLISAEDAEAARLEVSRRLLTVARRTKGALGETDTNRRTGGRAVALTAALIAVPLVSATMYVRLGSPYVASNQATATVSSAAGSESIETMIAQVEAHLRLNPNDGRGWEVLGPVYAKVGRYDDSVRAWTAAIKHLGENAERLEGLGESMVVAADGIVTADAKSVFDRALALDSTAVAARYYRGLAAKQDGLPEKAAELWREMIASAPSDAGWVTSVRTALSRLEAPNGEVLETTQKSAEAVANLPAPEQSEFVRTMVAGLAERLKADGRDPEAWVRLVRSYRVLGEMDKADAAAADARAALAGDPANLARLSNGLSALDSSSTAESGALPRPAAAAQSLTNQNDVKSDMTERLAERLHASGGEPEAWVLLVRSYKVLGKQDEANAAMSDARRAFATSPERLAQFEQALKNFEAAANAPQEQKEGSVSPPANGADAEDTDIIIRGMVKKLSERLSTKGGDAEAWLRLVRSYVVLGDKEKALAAVADARRNISSDETQLRSFEDGVSKLGLATN